MRLTCIGLAAVVLAVVPARADDPPQRYIVMEVSSSAVRAVAVDLPTPNGEAPVPVFAKESFGTNLVKKVKAEADGKKMYTPDAIETVLEKMVALLAEAKAAEPKAASPPKFGLFLSSGAAGAVDPSAVALLEAAIAGKKELAGLPKLSPNTSETEVRLSFRGAVPKADRRSAIALDVGSGDTKFGFGVETESGGWVMHPENIDSVAAGSKKKAADNAAYFDTLKNKIEQKFGSSDRLTIYVTGGMGWACTGLELPGRYSEDLRTRPRYIEVTGDELDRFFETAKKSAIVAKGDAPNAQKMAADIARVFSPDELMAGAELLKRSLLAFDAYNPGADGRPKRKVRLVPDSLFTNLIGYAEEMAPPQKPNPVALRLAAIEEKLNSLKAIEAAVTNSNGKTVDLKPVTDAIQKGFNEVVEQMKKPQTPPTPPTNLEPVLKELADIKKLLGQRPPSTTTTTTTAPSTKEKLGLLDPDRARGNFLRGMDLLLCQPDRALAHFHAAIAADDTEPTYWYGLALAQTRLGRSDDLRGAAGKLAWFQVGNPLLLAVLAPTFERQQGCDRAAVEAAVKAARDDLRLASVAR